MSAATCRVENLEWGRQFSKPSFDIVIGSDIAYPDTSTKVLEALFTTVSSAIDWEANCSTSRFICAFTERDRATATRFFDTAMRHRFEFSVIPWGCFCDEAPKTGTKLLRFRRLPSSGKLDARRLQCALCKAGVHTRKKVVGSLLARLRKGDTSV